MIDAAVLVGLLLEAEAPLLLVFGPKLPKEGHALTARTNNGLFADFLKELGTEVNPETFDLAKAANELLNSGYSFVLRPIEGGIYAYSRGKLNKLDQSQFRHFGLRSDSPIRYGTAFPGPVRSLKLSQLVTGGQGSDGAEGEEKAEILAFRSYENPSGGKYLRAALSRAAIEKGVAANLAYVIRHPGDSKVTFVTPARFAFTPEELDTIFKRFGLTADSEVEWYPGASGTAQTVTINDQWPTRQGARVQPPAGLATAPPKGLS